MGECIDCLENCTEYISDKCVKYTGADIACLGICTGDTLYEFEVAILSKICSILDGTGIDVSSLDLNCQFIIDLLDGGDKTLINILQVLIDGECSLRTLIQSLDDQINTPYSFNTSCLGTLPPNPTRDDILNAALIKLCSVNTRVAAIEADYVKDSQLCAKVTACLASGPTTQEYTKMSKYIAYPYHGPLTVFDSNGVGLSSAGYDKVYICNGQVVGVFNTPDYRGRSPLGANVGVPGVVAMDSTVNPTLPANAGYGLTPGIKLGSYTNTLSASQMPAHTHTLNDPGHSHTLPGVTFDGRGADGGKKATPATVTTTTESTGITIGSAGNSQPFNNLHPIVSTVMIMYIPT